MPLPIEDYAVLGNTRGAALVGKNGSIDWLCLPRFDSGACFAALLGSPEHGHWSIAPASGKHRTRRHYRAGTLVLESELSTDSGVVRVIDCMPPGRSTHDLVRVIEGVSGEVRMHMELIIRFDYGRIVPWVHRAGGALLAVGGPDALVLRTSLPVHGKGLSSVADFTIVPGQRVSCALSWYPSHEQPPAAFDAEQVLSDAEQWWRSWSSRCTYQGPWREAVVSSLVALKALTYAPTGGIVAAVTSSLPEAFGGVRNWDYRYCWLRDATFTLYALMLGGYREEASAWRDWLLRAVAGAPEQLQIMYGVAGEHRMPELTLDWLPGYLGAAPVRIGNGAAGQLQLDVHGEVSDALYQARKAGIELESSGWSLQRKMLEFLEGAWQKPDQGLWEVRGPARHFTHSKIMTWVAFDRAVKSVERFRLNGPVERWRKLRDAIHEDVCSKGYDRTLGAFTQSYGSGTLDASALMAALVGFLPASDRRMISTVHAIEKRLVHGGLVRRYQTEAAEDGLPPGEGTFLACTFWLADNYALMGRFDDARSLFEHLLSLRNDVGLLAEEYEPATGRLLGNFPQAFSHVGLVNTAYNLTPRVTGPATERKSR